MDNKITKMIRDLTRSVGNHGRRIRRLETLQVPITLERPLGGHIIQDEGVSLPDQVYLNFEGFGIVASDDPGNGATVVTITVEDIFCRVHPLPVGWEIQEGAEYRYMKHSTAFQLSDGGNDRGSYAIDLQQSRFNDDDVAAGNFSAILAGEENEIIDPGGFDSEYSVIIGPFNTIDTGYECYVFGGSNTIDGGAFGSYQVSAFGSSMYDQYSNYLFLAGYNHDSINAFGCFALGEANDLIENVNDNPTYSGAIGVLNQMEGDVYISFMGGEENDLFGTGSPADNIALWDFLWGFRSYIGNVDTNIMLGQGGRSYEATHTGLLDGRIVWSGDYPREWPAGSVPPEGTGSSSPSGFNQLSWFSQNDKITDWTSSFVTSRFEFPIIQDSIWYFEAKIAGIELGAGNSYSWKIEGVVENDGGTTTILTSTVTNIYRDVATKEWQAAADDANDRLIFQYRDTAGADSTDCNIQFSMHTVEVGFD